MVKSPRIVVCYVYPHDGAMGFAPKALEFVQSYQRHPPGMEHETVVVCNGAPATQPSKDLFNGLPGLTFIDHDNSGWDIGAFQLAARVVPCDLMVFCGSHTYFRKPGWLTRMHEVACELGDTLYGASGHQGDLVSGPHPHVRSTGFWCSPSLLNRYPFPIITTGSGGDRYGFEHGPDCFTTWVKKQGRQPWIVAWDCVFPLESCNSIPNGYHQGNQENLLVGDRVTCPPFYHTP